MVLSLSVKVHFFQFTLHIFLGQDHLIDRVHQGVERAGLLYVGDCKMVAEKTRAHVQAQGDFYLCPLSALHVPPATLAQNVETYLAAGSPLIQVVREAEADQPTCIAQG